MILNIIIIVLPNHHFIYLYYSQQVTLKKSFLTFIKIKVKYFLINFIYPVQVFNIV